MIRQIFESEKSGLKRISMIFGRVLDLGIKIPDDFYSFIRGKAMLEKQLLEYSAKLLSIDSKAKIKTANEIYSDVVLSKFFSVRGLLGKLASSENRNYATFSSEIADVLLRGSWNLAKIKLNQCTSFLKPITKLSP